MTETKRRARLNKTAFHTDEFDILNGRAKIFRTLASGDVWQLRMWISSEKKYVRRTLRTRDYETAVRLAEDEVLKVLSDVQSGRKIFSITLGELVEEYKKWRQEDVEVGNITLGRLITISSQLKHLLEYKSTSFKVSELSRDSLHDYANWRKLNAKNGVRDVTIVNEQATINHMQSMAWRKGHANFDKYYFRKINIANREGYGRRGIFTLAEYDALVRYMRTYTSKAECIDEKQRLERLLIKDCVLIASNTMARVGELWQLKWGDVENIEKITDDIGKDRFLVTLNIRAETSKVRKDRRIKTRGGEYFRRLKERAAHSSSDDYVFASIGGKSKISKQKWYLHWENLMRGIGLDYKSRNITWYSLRHFGITARLRAQVSHTDIAAIAGTGVLNIQNHYGHIDLEMQKRAALKNFKIHKDGISENEQ